MALLEVIFTQKLPSKNQCWPQTPRQRSLCASPRETILSSRTWDS